MKKNLKEKVVDAALEKGKTFAESKMIEKTDDIIVGVCHRVKEKFSEEGLDKVDKVSDVVDVTENPIWVLSKVNDLKNIVGNFIDGKIKKSEFIESIVSKASDVVFKLVKQATVISGYTLSALSLGLPLAVENFLDSLEAIGNCAGAVASKIFCFVFEPFVNAARKKEARERYEFLHEIYQNAILQMREQRLNFERSAKKFLIHRAEVIDTCFKQLDEIGLGGDADKFSHALDNLAKEFNGGKGLTFKDYKSFEDFINDEDSKLIW